MIEAKPTCGWNEAKPSFLPDDQITESTDNTLVRAAVRIADLERERDEARADVARLRDALDFTLSCLKHHHMTKPGIPTLVEKAEAKAKIGQATLDSADKNYTEGKNHVA